VPGVRAVVDAVEPALPAGVTVQTVISVSDQMIVENRTPTDLVVLGEGGEPFLRIGPQGVFANVKSPTWYRSNDPTGTAAPPKDADPAAPPSFARASAEPSWGWFDHRMHKVTLSKAPTLKAARLESWEVPMRYGDTAVVVKGHREYKPLTGAFDAKVLKAPAGLRALALPGVVPALAVSVAGAGPVVTILGEHDEPMARLSAAGGLEVNEASPTWVFTAEARGGAPRTGAVGPSEPPRWVKQGGGAQVTWLDRRAQLVTPDGEGRPGQQKRWRVPVLVGERPGAIEGVTAWAPFPTAPASPSSRPWWRSPWATGGAAALVAAAAVAWLGRRGVRSR
jgi:hypothetical protein